MLQDEELLRLFEISGAIRHGHFELSSGLHSGTYVQCALVLQYPLYAEKLGRALAALFSDATIEAVVSPALGGIGPCPSQRAAAAEFPPFLSNATPPE